jgi:glycosyltransferase involved in cell wall biosynthesis
MICVCHFKQQFDYSRDENHPSVRVLMGMPDGKSLGGPAACEPPFVAELRQLGVEVTEEIYVYGEKLGKTTLWQRIVRVLGTARRLRHRLRHEPFDLIHLNTSFDTMALLRDAATIMILHRSRAKIFLKFHGSDAALLKTNHFALRWLVRFVLARVDAAALLSSEERENFRRAGVDECKLFVVKNVVLSETHASSGANLAEKLNVPDETPLLLFIARFIPAKGLSDVIQACALVRDAGYEFKLLCVGDGPARAGAEREAAQLNLSERVRFYGYVPEAETPEFYAGSTILLFPTYHYEGFPLVIFKSVAAGLPVITTRIRAAADYLSEPDNCLWVEPKNPAALAEKIIRLLRDAPQRAAMREHNLELARQFTAAAVAPEYLDIYNQLVSRQASESA